MALHSGVAPVGAATAFAGALLFGMDFPLMMDEWMFGTVHDELIVSTHVPHCAVSIDVGFKEMIVKDFSAVFFLHNQKKLLIKLGHF